MNTIATSSAAQAQHDIAEEFAFFGDWTERYQYLIDLGRKLPPLPDELKTEAHKVHGCQSQVWLVADGDAHALTFRAISDSAIVSGLIALLLRVYSGRSAAEILAVPASGVGHAVPQIHAAALAGGEIENHVLADHVRVVAPARHRLAELRDHVGARDALGQVEQHDFGDHGIPPGGVDARMTGAGAFQVKPKPCGRAPHPPEAAGSFPPGMP